MKSGFSYSYTKKGPGRRAKAPQWLRDARRNLRALWGMRHSKSGITGHIETRKGRFVKVTNHDLRYRSRLGGH